MGRIEPEASDKDTLRQQLAAILSADVAGYSRLMGADERATVSALDGVGTRADHVAAPAGRPSITAHAALLPVAWRPAAECRRPPPAAVMRLVREGWLPCHSSNGAKLTPCYRLF